MSRKHETTTLREVAKTANVSEMTVSRVLRGKTNVAETTRQKVMEAVDRLGFVPNKIAGVLATSGSSNLVAVILPSLKSQIFTEVLSGITTQLETEGYKAVIGISDYDQGKEEELIQSMMSWRPCGLIVSNTSHSERARRIMLKSGIPIVEMMEVIDDPVDSCVGIVHEKAGELIADHFLEKDYRNIGYIGWSGDNMAVAKRRDGFTRRLATAQISIREQLLFDRPPDTEMGKQGTRQLLQSARDLDAIYYSNDIAAVGGLLHCLSEGISVPSDLAIAGFSGLKLGQLMPQPLTTVRLTRFDIGSKSAKLITDRLAGKSPAKIHELDLEFVRGQTS